VTLEPPVLKNALTILARAVMRSAWVRQSDHMYQPAVAGALANEASPEGGNWVL
jgi:hypothetical protein